MRLFYQHLNTCESARNLPCVKNALDIGKRLERKVNMAETQYPDYKLLPYVFEAWLRRRFSDPSIEVQVRPSFRCNESWLTVYK